MEKLSFLVFGAGAIGTYIGGSLLLAGHSVSFLEQLEIVEILTTRGLKLDLSADPRRKSSPVVSLSKRDYPLAFHSSIEEALAAGTYDFSIFALKSFDTASAAAALQPFASQMPLLLCLSNGVENEAVLGSALGNDKVLAGTVTTSVARLGPGEIVLERLRGVGMQDGHPLSLCLGSALEEAGLNVRYYPRPAEMKWSKLLTNLLGNASSAILDMPPAEVLADARLFRLEMSMLREALTVMRRKGIRVVNTPKAPVKLLSMAAFLPAFLAKPLVSRAAGGARGAKMPSFHIDLHAKRGITEVQWLNGIVSRLGTELKIPTPVNTALTNTLLSLTCGDLPVETMRRQPEKLLELVQAQRMKSRGSG